MKNLKHVFILFETFIQESKITSNKNKNKIIFMKQTLKNVYFVWNNHTLPLDCLLFSLFYHNLL